MPLQDRSLSEVTVRCIEHETRKLVEPAVEAAHTGLRVRLNVQSITTAVIGVALNEHTCGHLVTPLSNSTLPML